MLSTLLVCFVMLMKMAAQGICDPLITLTFVKWTRAIMQSVEIILPSKFKDSDFLPDRHSICTLAVLGPKHR
jgi:hypothetical protein